MGCVTYTDANRKDIGILQDATCDFAFGDDENSFSVTLDRSAGLSLEPCSMTYIEGTEFGGMITQCDTDTDPSVDTLIYNGLTWHGMLNTHVIEPDAGTDHYVVSGEANAVLAQLVAKLGIGDLFAASDENSRIRINNYQFNRYVEAYTGIRSMLVTVGCKLHIEYDGEKAILSAVPIADYSTTQAVDTDKLVLQMSKTFLPVNHLICLGEGELKERTVIHLYANEKGIVSQTQTFFGSMENALVYDYSSAEADELLEEGKKKLEELQCCDSSEAKFFEDRDYDIDDIVGTYDAFTGEFVTATISKKILSVDRYGTMTVDYQIGNVVSSNVSMTGSSDSINLYTRVSQAETTARNAEEVAADAKTIASGKADSGHKHSAADITSGTLAIDRGGTGSSAVHGLGGIIHTLFPGEPDASLGFIPAFGSGWERSGYMSIAALRSALGINAYVVASGTSGSWAYIEYSNGQFIAFTCNQHTACGTGSQQTTFIPPFPVAVSPTEPLMLATLRGVIGRVVATYYVQSENKFYLHWVNENGGNHVYFNIFICGYYS